MLNNNYLLIGTITNDIYKDGILYGGSGVYSSLTAKNFELDPSQIKKEMTPADIETWDSLSQLNLISAIEKEFQIKLEIDEIFTVMKIGDIYDLLSKKGVL